MRMIQRHLVGAFLCLCLAFPGGLARAEAPGPLVAAASSLQEVLPELAERFAVRSGHRVRLVFGASGNLSRQIAQGAPFALFLAADERSVRVLASTGRLEDAGIVYALGRLALLLPDTSPLAMPDGPDTLAALLADDRLQRLAIANPEHAPYGVAARQVLRRLGLWERLQSRLVLGESVAQAAWFAATGNAQAGLIAHSLALSQKLAEGGRHWLIPASWHAPLRQRGVLIQGADPVARRFLAFLLGDEGRARFLRHGFALPDGAS